MDTGDGATLKSGTRSILHEGYLHKKGQINRSWKRRYFVLYNDKKLAYYVNKEAIHSAPINEVNLSIVQSLSLLPYSTTPKRHRPASARLSKVGASFTDMFGSNRNTRTKSKSYSTQSVDSDELISVDRSLHHRQSEPNCNLVHLHHHHHHDTDCKQEEGVVISQSKTNQNDIYVDAPINDTATCSREHSFELSTDKRSYWLNCHNINELSEWIIHLKYAIFGKRIFEGFLTKKTKKLQTKWKRRYIEVFESKFIRIYKDRQKVKVKEQIDLNALSISVIKYGRSDVHEHPNILEMYDSNGSLIHVFSAESRQIRDQFMDALFLTMNAHKINVLCEGPLHFRFDAVDVPNAVHPHNSSRCHSYSGNRNNRNNNAVSHWGHSYFVLTEGSLLLFRDSVSCEEFKHSIFASSDFYSAALPKFVQQVIPMVDPQIEKREETIPKSISNDQSNVDESTVLSTPETMTATFKMFTITTSIGKCHFGVEDTTQYLLWCQAMNRYCRCNLGRKSFGSHLSVNGKSRNSKLFTDDQKLQIQQLLNPSDDSPSPRTRSSRSRLSLRDNSHLMAIKDDEEHDAVITTTSGTSLHGVHSSVSDRRGIRKRGRNRNRSSSFGSNVENGLLSEHLVMAVNTAMTSATKNDQQPVPLTSSVSMRVSLLKRQEVIGHSEEEESMDSVFAKYPMTETITDHELYSGDSMHSKRDLRDDDKGSNSSMMMLDETEESHYDEYEAGGYATDSTESSENDGRDCLEETVTEIERMHTITATDNAFMYTE